MTGTQTQRMGQDGLSAGENNVSLRDDSSGVTGIGNIFNIKGGRLLLQNLVPTNPADRALQVGQTLKNGTVVISVDLENNKAWFVPAQIFGGRAPYREQIDVIESVNRNELHGHNDWRQLTVDESRTLAKIWGQVAPIERQGPVAPWFWTSIRIDNLGQLIRAGEEKCTYSHLSSDDAHPVAIVRSGPALVTKDLIID